MMRLFLFEMYSSYNDCSTVGLAVSACFSILTSSFNGTSSSESLDSGEGICFYVLLPKIIQDKLASLLLSTHYVCANLILIYKSVD